MEGGNQSVNRPAPGGGGDWKPFRSHLPGFKREKTRDLTIGMTRPWVSRAVEVAYRTNDRTAATRSRIWNPPTKLAPGGRAFLEKSRSYNCFPTG